jgi:hypothetical protein
MGLLSAGLFQEATADARVRGLSLVSRHSNFVPRTSEVSVHGAMHGLGD